MYKRQPVEDPQIALAVIVENGGGGSKVAAPIGRALFDYWVLQRSKNPVLPPSEEELAKQRAEKQAIMQAKIDALDKQKENEKSKEKTKTPKTQGGQP